ncbi:hypothetical protein [Pseudomonas aeruginosa]|uniref:hypothetical protein n=1 Tax=Pseudomonas aeruginosa TaxID=287 RepID=UPI000A9A1AE7|nr:hypothetical protein [Pseudomonas aeruginosa]
MLMNTDLSATFSGGKQNPSYCQVIFETGENRQGVPVMMLGVNLIQMFKEG